MQVVILCGGQGTRIRDVADDIPKPMISIGGRPILWHIMKGYAQHGFTDFVLCLGYKGWAIKRYFLDYHLAGSSFRLRLNNPDEVRVLDSTNQEDWTITFAETGVDAQTGCRVKRVESYVTGDNFMLTYGDGVSDLNIRQLVDFHLEHGKIGTVTAVRPPGRFGEIEIDGQHVREFMEKPLIARGRISGGFFVFRREIFSRLQNDPGLIFEYGPMMQLAHGGQLMAHLHNGFWQAMDNSRDFKYLNELWAEGKAPWNTWEPVRLRAAA